MAEKTYLWENFQQHPKPVQDELLKEFLATLPDMTQDDLIASLKGAPAHVIIKAMSELDSDLQVMIWKKCLPVGARKDAMKVLRVNAQIKLNLRPKNFCLG